jgi:hypothetical protein
VLFPRKCDAESEINVLLWKTLDQQKKTFSDLNSWMITKRTQKIFSECLFFIFQCPPSPILTNISLRSILKGT